MPLLTSNQNGTHSCPPPFLHGSNVDKLEIRRIGIFGLRNPDAADNVDPRTTDRAFECLDRRLVENVAAKHARSHLKREPKIRDPKSSDVSKVGFESSLHWTDCREQTCSARSTKPFRHPARQRHSTLQGIQGIS